MVVWLALLLVAQGLALGHRVAHGSHGAQGSHDAHEAHPHADGHAWGGQHEEGDAACHLADALGVADAAAGPLWAGVAAPQPERHARPACPAGLTVSASRPYQARAPPRLA